MVVCLVVALLLFAFYVAYKVGQGEAEELTQDNADLVEAISLLRGDNAELANQLKRTVHQKKSSEVITGLIVEQMAPFLKEFPYDPKESNFLGRPIDFIAFDSEGIHFVEVKSGRSQLSAVQRRIRDQIKNNKVTFEVYRIKGE